MTTTPTVAPNLDLLLTETWAESTHQDTGLVLAAAVLDDHDRQQHGGHPAYCDVAAACRLAHRAQKNGRDLTEQIEGLHEDLAHAREALGEQEAKTARRKKDLDELRERVHRFKANLDDALTESGEVGDDAEYRGLRIALGFYETVLARHA